MEGGIGNGNGNVAKGEKGSGSRSEGVACDLVAALRCGSAVTRKRTDRGVSRRKMRSSLAPVSAPACSSSSSLCFSSLTVASGQHVVPDPVVIVAAPPPPPSSQMPPAFRLTPVYDVDRSKLRFLFQKILKNSDVNYLKRIIIPKKAAEEYLPALHTRAIQLTINDVDGHHKWTFKYRFWPNNASRMYVLENAGEFVAAHDLRAGDCFIMYIDIETQNLVIEAKKSGAPKPSAESEIKSETAISQIDIFPKAPLDDTTDQFFYDTSSFCNESPLDFLGGSSYQRYPCSSQNDFVDNISFDDFHF